MASLKRCDACHEIWDPEEHREEWGGSTTVDQNCGSVSLSAPSYRSKNHKWGSRISQHWEICQSCARAIHTFIEGLKPST